MPDLIVCPFDPAQLRSAHGGTILAHGGFPLHPEIRFGSAWGCLKPGMAQEPLRQDNIAKVYVVLQGSIRITADGKASEVHAGQAVFIPAGTLHSVEQIGEEEFIDFAFWWEVDAAGTGIAR